MGSQLGCHTDLGGEQAELVKVLLAAGVLELADHLVDAEAGERGQLVADLVEAAQRDLARSGRLRVR